MIRVSRNALADRLTGDEIEERRARRRSRRRRCFDCGGAVTERGACVQRPAGHVGAESGGAS